MLAARSDFFLEALLTRWSSKGKVTLRKSNMDSQALHLLLMYLYQGRVDIPENLIADLKKLATHCKLLDLIREIEIAEKRITELVNLKPSIGRKVKILSVESENSFANLREDLRELAESTLPIELRSWIDEGILPFYDERISFYPDVCIEVENQSFYCHQVFLCGRTDFFKALLSDHFHEISKSEILTIHLRYLSAEIFRHIVIYIYSGKTEFENIDETLEVLITADMMLLPGLKKSCGTILSKRLTEDNVLELYRQSQVYNLLNLEDKCTSMMAVTLDSLVESEDFMELVTEQAYQVESREEMDSIPIVDDIRHCITTATTTMGEVEDANRKLTRLDAMLARLGIEC